MEISKSDKLAAEEVGEGDDNARRRQREKLNIMLQKIEEQLKPLTQQLARVRDLPVPEFGSRQAWKARNSVGQIPNGDSGANDSSRNSQDQGYGGTSIPFLGETRGLIFASVSFLQTRIIHNNQTKHVVDFLLSWDVNNVVVHHIMRLT